MILTREFYNRSTIKVARELLGHYLVKKTPSGLMMGRIIETEAYCGPKDKANHASKGLTERTAPMFGPAGYSYIYLVYGMYCCLNIVTEKEGYPAAVLIRSIEPIKGINLMMKNRCLVRTGHCPILTTNGPGKLCQALNLTKKQNNLDITTKKNDLWVETPPKKNKITIKKGPRIGIDYAGKYKDKLWRFWI
jgi:DNA-3-methyladenine glycosylase